MIFCKFNYDSDLTLHFNDSYSVGVEAENCTICVCLFVPVSIQDGNGSSIAPGHYKFLQHIARTLSRFIKTNTNLMASESCYG